MARLLAVILAFCAAAAGAAEIRLVSYRYSAESPVPHLRLDGPIIKGDAEKFARVWADIGRCAGPACTEAGTGGPAVVLSLNSPGGSYAEGVALADLFRRDIVATVVESGDECLSACAMAFLGGTAFWPTGGIGRYIDRSIEPGARLGFHSPYFPPAVVEQAIQRGKLEALLTGLRLSIADIVENLTRFNVDKLVLDRIIRMGAEELYLVDTPAELFATRTRLPDFAPARVGGDWTAQLAQVCARLYALHYGVAVSDPDPVGPSDLGRVTAEDGTEVYLLPSDDRPLNVSGCGVPVSGARAPVQSVALYRWEAVSDRHIPLLTFKNPVDGGWSSLGYRGGRATDNFVSLGTGALNHVLMPGGLPLDSLTGLLPEIRRERGDLPGTSLPTHTTPWPVRLSVETDRSRSYEGQGLRVVERVGNRALFDALLAGAGGTEVGYAYTKPEKFVRTGDDRSNGSSYYWLGFLYGNRAATVRIEAPVSSDRLTQAQKDAISTIACSVDFNGVHLGCYK
ncbi:hypothetical protein VK792_11680 [Mesobacterium sp. TK19101]|uniref:Uncharacterized protein n=1 Tax=Mesobacterium hydrothermale TaxID=3111907 RepID=A0ABU6HHK6_9RHOB|nr:hypothetical protein [Mesobacterium sp. TK19101]MEC3861945.1 hypothetical protein [Mesobacterium sp. TK19101]